MILPGSRLDPDAVTDAVREVLARPEYVRPAPGPVARLRSAVLEFLADIVARLLGSGAAGWLGWVITAVAVTVVVLLVVRYTRRVSRDPGVAAVDPPVSVKSAAAWRADADRHEASGDWAEAVRCRYRAALAELVAHGLVEEVAGRTAGEYEREVVSAVPGASGPFSDLTDRFQRIWYGSTHAGRSDATRARELTERVVAGLP